MNKIEHTFSEWTKEEHFTMGTGTGTILGVVIKNGKKTLYKNHAKIEYINELHPVEIEMLSELVDYADINTELNYKKKEVV